MSIERDYDQYIPVCDYCGRELPAEDSFQDAMDAKDAAGWKHVITGTDWYDYCPACYVENEFSHD